MCLDISFFTERDEWVAQRKLCGDVALSDFCLQHDVEVADFIVTGLFVAKTRISTACLIDYCLSPLGRKYCLMKYDSVVVKSKQVEALVLLLGSIESFSPLAMR